jgi:hypothetical protein
MSIDVFSNQRKRSQLDQLTSNQITAGTSWSITVGDQPAERAVDTVYLRVQGTLLDGGATATRVAIDNDAARARFLTAILSRVQAKYGSASLSGIEVIESMSLGQHFDGLRSIGVKPVCPQLFDHYGAQALVPRVGFTPGVKCTYFTLDYPLIVCAPHADMGFSALLGADQLKGLTVNGTTGNLTFVDDASVSWTIGGADGATGTRLYVDVQASYRDLPAGVRVEGNPITFHYLTTSQTDYATVNPEGGAILGLMLRLPTATSLTPPDSIDALSRFVYGAVGFSASAWAAYRIRLRLDGCEQPDHADRDLYEIGAAPLFDLPGVEAGQNEFIYSLSTTLLAGVSPAMQGGLQVAGLHGDTPLNRVLFGKLDMLVPSTIPGNRERIVVQWRKASACLCQHAANQAPLASKAPAMSTAGPMTVSMLATLGSTAYGEGAAS